jgi:hypothetical protein
MNRPPEFSKENRRLRKKFGVYLVSGNGQLLNTRPGLAPQPSYGTTSAPAKQQALKTEMDI